MKKEIKDMSYNDRSYKHGNYMIASTALGICTLMVLMLQATAFKSSVNSLMTARSFSGIISALFFIAFVVLTVLSAKRERGLWEYAAYSFVMSIGFLSLLGVPFFLPATAFFETLFTTRNAQAGLLIANIIYLAVTLTYHTVKSKPGK